MDSRTSGNGVHLWSGIIGTEENQHRQQGHPQIAVIYRRRRSDDPPKDEATTKCSSTNVGRVSFAVPPKRVSWNRSLSTRGRTSIAVAVCVEFQAQQKKERRKAKPPIPKGKNLRRLNFDKERAYFQEVDSFELLEESPSPKNFSTWKVGIENDNNSLPPLSSALQKWLVSKKLNSSYGPSGSLSKILETSTGSLRLSNHDSPDKRTPEKDYLRMHSDLISHQNRKGSSFAEEDVHESHISSQNIERETLIIGDADHEKLEASIRKLSLTSYQDAFSTLLAVCGQSVPSKLLDVLSKFCEPGSIIKIGEGTYGEAFKAGNAVCKIVPINGDFQVNGAEQKKSQELLEEVVLARTLNNLRGCGSHVCNTTTSFIETLDIVVCQGLYDAAIIKAWEEWDGKHGSENDHPNEFPEKQCYVVFVLEHGGQDLESFVLLNFDEARSLLVQVTAALAVAEAAYEFEHRDLHWGNILLSRKDSETQIVLEGRHMLVENYGLTISIIDFTLSRINTGEDILYLDLSLDHELFEGPKGDKQSDTYRKMKDITHDCWEESFPKTNVLWLQYLVDILLLKKTFKRTSNDERELRSLKKRLNACGSAKEAISDPFFNGLLVEKESNKR